MSAKLEVVNVAFPVMMKEWGVIRSSSSSSSSNSSSISSSKAWRVWTGVAMVRLADQVR
jgi:hypothetical protein